MSSWGGEERTPCTLPLDPPLGLLPGSCNSYIPQSHERVRYWPRGLVLNLFNILGPK